jgi:hypothetical protein
MMKQGVKVISPSRNQIDEFRRLSNNALPQIIGPTFSKKVFEEVVSLLESYRRGGK